MGRTKQTARISSGGNAPKKLMQCATQQSYRQFMTGQQQATYAGTAQSKKNQVTSYLNYENIFASFGFQTGAISKMNFEPRFNAGSLCLTMSKFKSILCV